MGENKCLLTIKSCAGAHESADARPPHVHTDTFANAFRQTHTDDPLQRSKGHTPGNSTQKKVKLLEIMKSHQ